MSEIVSDTDLNELCGLERPTAQARWLRDNRIAFLRRADGRPRTTWTAVNRALLGHDPSLEPNLAEVD